VKIVLFNWAPVYGSFNEGGGVSVYLKNIVDAFSKKGHDVTVISSGFFYNILRNDTYVKRTKTINGAKYIDIVNSGVLAPSYLMFQNIERAMKEDKTVKVFKSILDKLGDIDIVHFQNVEGLPWNVLELKKYFPKAKFILSNHNFHAICQQVNLWHQDRSNCTDYNRGEKCYSCNIFVENYIRTFSKRNASYYLGRDAVKDDKFLLFLFMLGTFYLNLNGDWLKKLHSKRSSLEGNIEHSPAAGKFLRRREYAVEMINKYCDTVISVSKEVENILIKNGVEKDKSIVSYIGTKHFKNQKLHGKPLVENRFTLAFLGYTRPDKGFQFIVDAFENMPSDLYGKLGFLFAGKITDPGSISKLEKNRQKFQSLTIIDSYKHNDLEGILEKVDIGIVPPLWHDALPQVAIEFLCHQIPIFVSDTGGQKEITVDPSFIFSSGDLNSFWEKMREIVTKKEMIADFWKLNRNLYNMEQHADDILDIYQGVAHSDHA
jgi:glycosyltransferase involved in cell wall biosynthesis